MTGAAMENTPHRHSADCLLEAHIERVRLYLRRRLSCEHDVQDLAQEACLKMLQAERNGEIRQPRAYLHQIANHLLYQHYNGRAQRLHTGIDLDSVVSPRLPLEETVELQVRQQQIEQAMRTLPPKCQTVVVLRWRHGLRVAEIAEHMNLSRGMVKKYLANGLEHFRRRLRRFAHAESV